LFCLEKSLLLKMPLVIFCGPPCSGKTTHAQTLSTHLKDQLKQEVHLINEESLQITKNIGYAGLFIFCKIDFL
jgi:broad-specificity NMP kinase